MAASGTSPGADDRTHLLDPAPGPAPAAAASEVGPGARIGPYTLLDFIGEGGMGQVFLAEQVEPIRRRVAVKLIRRQIADTLALAYFEIERQALARMEHPAIARVYDAGRTAQGYPYFAMEYVDGVSLSVWHRQGRPDLATRLRVFATLARGVQHAHERGIVHRDLKPDNVLVTEIDGQPQPKLIDFGIAIGVDESGTGSVLRAGTADYMSPEQFAQGHAAIDARSDVYSLGMILLRLLLPDGRAHGEPTQRPSELHARLRASIEKAVDPDFRIVPLELRHLLARALDPDRNRRYDSAAALADEVQRYLWQRPLKAVPRTHRYRLRKFIRRHRAGVAFGAAITLAVVAGLAATLWSLARAEREAERSRATAQFLSSVLSGVDPDIARDLDKTLLRQVLDEAAARATRELAAQPEVLAEIQDVIAGSYLRLADYARALEHAGSAYEAAVADHGRDSAQASAALPNYAAALLQSGKADAAETLLRPAVAATAARDGADAPSTLRLRHQLGITLRGLGRPQDARAELTQASEGLRRGLGADHGDTIDAEVTLAITLADLDRFDEAIAMLRDLIARRSAALGADHPATLSMRNSLAVFYLQARRFADGERELRSLLEPYQRQHGPDNGNTLMIVGNLGGALRQQGKIEESGPYYLRAKEGHLRHYGADHPNSVATAHNYANWLLDAGRADESLAEQQAVLATAERLYPEPHPIKGEILTGIGKARTRLGRYAEAEQDLLRSIELKIATHGPGNSRLPASREALRELYTAWNRPGDAARYAEPPP
ncbi:MAG TPA: serine/threonine-protein kinase [Dokdonella sp.]|uniref:serine/threonine-protein kinase n=1 Tax=Dokdonella sp. TaxID=2291710 RepID=UPI002BE5C77A|nr:serine/threonine-protein kinase [Dokdonella sp.]HUD42977.1 serine/threonine-protein kinase [Dokdonella sp.]